MILFAFSRLRCQAFSILCTTGVAGLGLSANYSWRCRWKRCFSYLLRSSLHGLLLSEVQYCLFQKILAPYFFT